MIHLGLFYHWFHTKNLLFSLSLLELRKSISIMSSSIPWWVVFEDAVVVVGSANGFVGRNDCSSVTSMFIIKRTERYLKISSNALFFRVLAWIWRANSDKMLEKQLAGLFLWASSLYLLLRNLGKEKVQAYKRRSLSVVRKVNYFII